MLPRVLEQCARLLAQVEGHLADGRRICSYLRGRLEFVTRPDDLFVVSYPRSGTTWMQMILHQLLTDGRLDFTHITEVQPWFERSLAIGSRTAADLATLPAPRVFKSHLPYAWIPRGARYIYLAREPADVAVSYYHLYRTHLRYRGDLEDFVQRFLAGELQYRSWFDHVASWRARRGDARVLFLEYEALQRSLSDAVDRVAEFCGVALSAAHRKRVISRSRFSYMKRHEDRFDHLTSLLLERGLARGAFLREGRVGAGAPQLTAAQRRTLADRVAAGPGRPPRPWHLADFLH